MENKNGIKNESNQKEEIKTDQINEIKINESNNEDENNKIIEEIEEKENFVPITKNSNLSPDLFLISSISEYKCICNLIPNPEIAREKICCGTLVCDKCFKQESENKECSVCKSKEISFRKIKEENKVFYKIFKNLKIKCPYKCEWKGAWLDLDIHLIECKFGIRYCKYNSIGCKFLDKCDKVIEHEKNNDKLHLEMALKFIKTNNIVKKQIKLKFILGEKCKTSVHPHIMTYMTSFDWNCDGRKLPNGCYSRNYSFSVNIPRFRCPLCDFDLCDKCIVNYLINS